jgi:hypothetical protein
MFSGPDHIIIRPSAASSDSATTNRTTASPSASTACCSRLDEIPPCGSNLLPTRHSPTTSSPYSTSAPHRSWYGRSTSTRCPLSCSTPRTSACWDDFAASSQRRIPAAHRCVDLPLLRWRAKLLNACDCVARSSYGVDGVFALAWNRIQACLPGATSYLRSHSNHLLYKSYDSTTAGLIVKMPRSTVHGPSPDLLT